MAMSRKGRRDCRTGDRKKNHMNKRIDEMQRAIRKEKKSKAAAGETAEAAKEKLTPSAAAFLAQMKEDVAAGIEKAREQHLPKASNSKS